VQSTRHDANLAALHASSGLPGSVVDVVVLTADTGLLATLREASSQEHAIWHAPTADVAVDLLVGGRCGILVADLGTLRSDAASLLDRLGAQFPELILLATGRREEEGSVAGLISKGLIYRFLHKPISPARASLFISTASRRYHELRDVQPVAMTTVKTIATRSPVTKIAIAAIVLLLAVLGVFLWSTRDTELPAPAQPRQVGTRTTQEQVAELLGSAEMAYATGRYSEPRGDNALGYFRAVLELQPDNADAKAGIERVVAALEARVREALEARNAPQGAIALTALQRAQPDHPQLEALSAELVAISRSARPATTVLPAASAPSRLPSPAASAPAAPQAAEPERSVEASEAPAADSGDNVSPIAVKGEPSPEEIAAIVQLRERGALVAPAGANAYDAMLELRERFPKAEAVAGEQQRLAFAMLDRARTALAAGALDETEDYLERADTLVPGMAVVRSLQDKLAIAQEQRAFMQNVVPAANLKRVREVPPEYPREAERAGTEGWVDVEFTIAEDGTTHDLIVRGAQPAGVFDRAASESVARWKFEPILKDGVAVRQRAVLRVRFVVEG
jgi:TonB family protein